MSSQSNQTYRIAVIGGGISGIGAANVLQQLGHTVIVYERANDIGGVWSQAYPLVRLQNIAKQYRFAGIPWPFAPDLHPTAEQIMRYLHHVVDSQKIDLRLSHSVSEMSEVSGDGWKVTVDHDGRSEVLYFDKVIVAVGQYTQDKHRPVFSGEKQFSGKIITERDIDNFTEFKGKRVSVIGFGKSALDMATMVADHGGIVSHIFRTPRWVLPSRILGLHYTKLLFSRQSTMMMTSWAHPTSRARYLHEQMPTVVEKFWGSLESLLTRMALAKGRKFGEEGAARLRKVLPEHGLVSDLRSATALAPDNYFPFIAEGKIEPYHAELSGFTKNGTQLGDGSEINADVVILALGSSTPRFPFLPLEQRMIVESEADGVQLYRHLIHPVLRNVAFAGFNHGFLHIPAVEAGMLWVDAYFKGRIQAPTAEEMTQSMNVVRDWKRENIAFEPSRSCAVNTRFQQYLDVILLELGLSPYRKNPNFVAEFLAPYTIDDYDTIIDEYKALSPSAKFELLPVHT